MRTVKNKLLSKIGMGTWGVGGVYEINSKPAGICELGIEDPVELIREVYEFGVNVFDTSTMYGQAEERLATAFVKVREEVFISSKCGIKKDGSRDYGYENIQQSIHKTLSRLKSSFVDLFQVSFARDASKDDILSSIEYLDMFRKEGLIRYSGLSIATQAQGYWAVESGGIDALELVLNLNDTRMLGVINWARKKDISILVKSPLNKGVLSDSPLNFSSFDSRKNFLDETTILKRKRVARKILDDAKLENCNLEKNAIMFLLSMENIDTIFFGIRQKKHISDLLKYSKEDKLSKKNIESICKSSMKYFYEIEDTFI